MTCQLFSKERIDQLTEKVRSENLSIPREIHVFYKKHVMISAVKGDCIAEYYQPYHGTLLLRLFCLSVDRSSEKRRLEGNITEYGRRILGGDFILTNYSYSSMNGYCITHACGDISKNDSGWCIEENYVVGKKSSIWCLRPYCEGINLHKTITKFAPYCAYEQYHGTLTFFDYLEKYLKYPGVEMLVKMGYSNFISCLNVLNMKGKNFEQVFKVNNKWKEYLKSKYVSRNELLMIRRYPWLKNEDDLKRVKSILESYTKDGKYKYWASSGKRVFTDEEWEYALKNYDYFKISLYSDYLEFAHKLGYPLDQKKWHYPSPDKLKELHDKAYEEIEIIKGKKIDQDIAFHSKEAEEFTFTSDGFMIRPVHSNEELINESKVLNHCVRTYGERVAKGQTMIFFIRKSDNPATPYVTLEMSNKRIVQVRAENNSDPCEDVKNFIHTWSKKYKLKGQYA